MPQIYQKTDQQAKNISFLNWILKNPIKIKFIRESSAGWFGHFANLSKWEKKINFRAKAAEVGLVFANVEGSSVQAWDEVKIHIVFNATKKRIKPHSRLKSFRTWCSGK